MIVFWIDQGLSAYSSSIDQHEVSGLPDIAKRSYPATTLASVSGFQSSYRTLLSSTVRSRTNSGESDKLRTPDSRAKSASRLNELSVVAIREVALAAAWNVA